MNRSLIARFLLPAALFLATPAVAEQSRAIEVGVRLYNYAAAPADEVGRAKHEASRIFARSGVRLIWVTCTLSAEGQVVNSACHSLAGPEVLNLRLLPEQMEPTGGLPTGIFGFSRMSDRGGFASIANVYFERISAMAEARQSSRGVLLGTMMAHELGHLVLGVNSHSRRGLMYSPWGPRALAAVDRGLLGFSKRESHRLQEAAEARGTVSSPLRLAAPGH